VIRASLAEALVLRSLSGLGSRWPLRSARRPVYGKMVSFRTTHPGFPLPSRVKPSRSCPTRLFGVRAGQSPMRFLSPSASCRSWAATYLPGVPCPGLRYLLSVSHALEVLIRPSPAGLLSCRFRSWGFCLSRSSSPCGAVRPLGRPYPLAVDPGLVTGPRIQLQGLAPRTGTGLDRLPPVRTATPLGFCLPEVFPCTSWGWKSPALLDFADDASRWVIRCPSELAGWAVGWTLSSLPPSSRFRHLVVSSHLRDSLVSGLLLGDPRCFHRRCILYESNSSLPELSGLPFR